MGPGGEAKMKNLVGLSLRRTWSLILQQHGLKCQPRQTSLFTRGTITSWDRARLAGWLQRKMNIPSLSCTRYSM